MTSSINRLAPVEGGKRCAHGLNFGGMVGIVKALTPQDFHKSMTTHADHCIGRTCTVP